MSSHSMSVWREIKKIKICNLKLGGMTAIIKMNKPKGKRLRVRSNKMNGGAAIAQWIRLLRSCCRLGFESKAHHLLSNVCYICHVKKRK